ncbi:hypothetical protein [Qipengyuania sp.]|uniref:hypothetical protein n=1 Tax=Qipengyuania sp. TaxID=2004515 RepID=UPI003AF5F5BC
MHVMGKPCGGFRIAQPLLLPRGPRVADRGAVAVAILRAQNDQLVLQAGSDSATMIAPAK